jgi:hypothetical protein
MAGRPNDLVLHNMSFDLEPGMQVRITSTPSFPKVAPSRVHQLAPLKSPDSRPSRPAAMGADWEH